MFFIALAVYHTADMRGGGMEFSNQKEVEALRESGLHHDRKEKMLAIRITDKGAKTYVFAGRLKHGPWPVG